MVKINNEYEYKVCLENYNDYKDYKQTYYDSDRMTPTLHESCKIKDTYIYEYMKIVNNEWNSQYDELRNPSSLGTINEVVPQNICPDSRHYDKITLDKENEHNGRMHLGSYNLVRKSGKSMEREKDKDFDDHEDHQFYNKVSFLYLF